MLASTCSGGENVGDIVAEAKDVVSQNGRAADGEAQAVEIAFRHELVDGPGTWPPRSDEFALPRFWSNHLVWQGRNRVDARNSPQCNV